MGGQAPTDPHCMRPAGLLVKSTALAALGAIFVYTPTTLQPQTDQTWLFFDGVCNLCDGFVNFVADFESPRRVKFGAIQRHRELLGYSGAGQYAEGGSEALTTVVLVQDGSVYVRSTAALRVIAMLDFPFNCLSTFILLPTSVRDAAYKLVAKHRYAVFGQVGECRAPTERFQSRFLDFDPSAVEKNLKLPFQAE